MRKQPFGTTADGQAVELYTLTNAKGAEAAIMNYGGTIVSVKVPDNFPTAEKVSLVTGK